MSEWRVRAALTADLPALQQLGLPFVQTGGTAEDLGGVLLAEQLVEQGTAHGTAQILAALRLRPRIGLDLPRFWFHVGCVVHAAPELGLFHRERTLLLGNDHTGATELADLVWEQRRLDPAAQRAVLQMLVRAVLVLLARDLDADQEPTEGPTLIVELPGLCDSQAMPAFWQGLGMHFFPGSPSAAERQFGRHWLSHVAALLPRHPLVVSLLRSNAQQAIGEVDRGARLLQAVLEHEGLRRGQHVTLYDAGPVFEGKLSLLPAATQLRRMQVQLFDELREPRNYLVAPARTGQVWSVAAEYRGGAELALSSHSLRDTGLRAGDLVWAVAG